MSDRGFLGVGGRRIREDDEGHSREPYTRETDRALRHYMRLAAEAREDVLQREIEGLKARIVTLEQLGWKASS